MTAASNRVLYANALLEGGFGLMSLLWPHLFLERMLRAVGRGLSGVLSGGEIDPMTLTN